MNTAPVVSPICLQSSFMFALLFTHRALYRPNQVPPTNQGAVFGCQSFELPLSVNRAMSSGIDGAALGIFSEPRMPRRHDRMRDKVAASRL